MQRPNDGGLGCGRTDDGVFVPAPASDDGVNIISHTTVGDFDVYIIEPENPGETSPILHWLNLRGFTLSEDDAGRFAPSVEAGWIFTVMWLKSDVPETRSWDFSVDPVQLTFSAPELLVPLPILAIQRSGMLPMVFFVIDDYRVELDDFTTTYANRISPSEFDAIRTRHPSLAAYLGGAGKYVTRLDRVFGPGDPMDSSILLRKADSDREFRRVARASLPSRAPIELLVVVGVLGVLRLRGPRTRESS